MNKEPKIDPKLVIRTEPRMVREAGVMGEYLFIIPLIILILSIILI